MGASPASTVKPSITPNPQVSATKENQTLSITSANIRIWGKKSALSLIDQALTSGAGFGVTLLLARWLPGDAYGAFAVAFAVYLFISGFHNVLLLEPLSVIGPARYPERLSQYFRAQVQVHGVLVWPMAASLLIAAGILYRIAPHNPLVGALAGGGIALPFLLLLWLARRMCYVLQRPAVAIVGSGLALAFVIGALVLLRWIGWLSPLTVFAFLGLGSFFSASLVFHQLGFKVAQNKSAPAISWRKTLIENWTYGRWLVGSTMLFSISTQTQTFLVAAFLGLGAAGVLRATQIPSLVMSQVVVATGLLVLPTFSYDFGNGLFPRMRRKATLVSLSLGAAAIGYAGLLAVSANWTLRVLYGNKYSDVVWLVPILALIPVANGISTGYSMTLRAAQRPHFDLVANAIAAPIGVLSALLFIHLWGLFGAALSMLMSSVAVMIVVYVMYRRITGTMADARLAGVSSAYD